MQEVLAKHWNKRQFHTLTSLDHARGWGRPGGEPAKISGARSAPIEADCQRENTPALLLPWDRQWDSVRITGLLWASVMTRTELPRAPQAMTEDSRQSQRLCGHLSSVRLESNHTQPPRACQILTSVSSGLTLFSVTKCRNPELL